MLETNDPQQLGGYTYAGDNPVGGSDPSGLMLCAAGGPCGSAQAFSTLYANEAAQAESAQLNGCGAHMGCVMYTIRSYSNPTYAMNQGEVAGGVAMALDVAVNAGIAFSNGDYHRGSGWPPAKRRARLPSTPRCRSWWGEISRPLPVMGASHATATASGRAWSPHRYRQRVRSWLNRYRRRRGCR